MKTKPVIIASAIAVLLISSVLFILYGRSPKVNNEEGVNRFLATFNNYVNNGQPDSLLTCFEADSKNEAVKRLANLLTGKSGVNGTSAPLAKIKFNLDESTIATMADGTISATIPAFFSHGELESRRSVLMLKISLSADHQYKIIQADARQFLTDYVAYENFVRTSTLSDEDIYDPRTLKAFAAANQLKTRFDSVIWFSHIQDKTYYYVVNGKWEMSDLLRDTAKTYKMGLVGPDLKVIIPVDFDLVGQMDVTFPGLLEVHKNNKKGFYDISGRAVIPVVYDQVFPVDGEGDDIAALRNGDDYYWLKSDYTVSEKADIKIADILPKLKKTGSFSMNRGGDYGNMIEFNSRQEHGSIYLPPSYMADLNLLPVYKTFKNPMRKKVEYYDVSDNYVVNKEIIKNETDEPEADNWWQTAYYSIRDYYLGGRSEFYDSDNLVIIDKKHNRLYAVGLSTDFSEEGTESLAGPCEVSSIKALTDSLFEVKIGTVLSVPLYDSTKYVDGGPYYHYLKINNNKLVESHTERIFSFTKFVKMDDSYLNGCYILGTYIKDKPNTSKQIDHATTEMLRYMKNEIYADYGYEFKDKRWSDIFSYSMLYEYEDGKQVYNKNALDSLTAIDKYNINFIDQKLKSMKPNTLAAK